MLTGISQFCNASSLGSFHILEYLPTDWIDLATYEHMSNASGKFVGTISPSSGHDWLKAPLVRAQRPWNEDQRASDQSDAFDSFLSGIIVSASPLIQAEFEEMAEYDYILRVTDYSARVWLLGSIEYPYMFESKFSNGEEPLASRRHSIRFFSQSPIKALSIT